MKDCILRAIKIAALLSLVLISSSAFAQTDDPLFWPGYHFDNLHKGQNAKSSDITNPATLGLVWAFPRTGGTPLPDKLTVVDNTDTECSATGDWLNSPTAPSNFWGQNYSFIYAMPKGSSGVVACWRFPQRNMLDVDPTDPRVTGGGFFQVAVWVPPAPVLDDVQTTVPKAAVYTVYDDNGATSFKFDQNNYGRWELLTSSSFSFKNPPGTGKGYRVELSAEVDADQETIDAEHIVVLADAVKFIPATGMEIYASPASAEMPLFVENPDDPAVPYWDALSPFVFIGTVENPLVPTADPVDIGAVYCVNSITPTTSKASSPTETALSKLLGTNKWRYPKEDPNTWGDLEGPIEGGIFASPTLAYTDVAGTRTLVCFAAAMDRQIYALDASTGDLLWKGPGITKSEDATWTDESAPGRNDAFGGKYHYKQCASSSGPQMQWLFNPTDRTRSGCGDGSYIVYAWIPVYKSGDMGGKTPCTDAKYTITYIGGTYTASVDQSNPINQGRWVQLGNSYFGVGSVALSNATGKENPGNYAAMADAVMIVPSSIGEFGYCSPVADQKYSDPASNAQYLYDTNSAGRVLSFVLGGADLANKIGQMGWIYPQVASAPGGTTADSLGDIGASPALQNDQLNVAPKLFVATTQGRIYALTGITTTPTPAWPDPGYFHDEKALVADSEATAGFTSSPAISGDYLLIGSTGGLFYCINAGNGSLSWRYPDVDEIDPLPLGSFNYSTPAIAVDSEFHNRAWIGSSDGRVYSFAIDQSANPHRLEPDTSGSGAVNYIEPKLGVPIQGSVALDSTQTANGGSHRMLMYVGDMVDTLHWFDAQDGMSDFKVLKDPTDPTSEVVYTGWRCGGQLFSSPNITTCKAGVTRNPDVSWIYQGCSDGRIYAFSSKRGGAWGGEWSGGDWPYDSDPGESQAVEETRPDTPIQFDLFDADFYNSALRFNPELTYSKGSANFYLLPVFNGMDYDLPIWKDMKIQNGTSVSNDITLNANLANAAKTRRYNVFDKTGRISTGARSATDGLYFEWGETLYLMIWNLPGKKFLEGSDDSSRLNHIEINFTNSSPGEAAGGTMRLPATTKLLREYTVLDENRPVSDGTVSGYQPFRSYTSGNDVKRCYLLAKITIDGKNVRPSPGPGWTLTARIRAKDTDSHNAPYVDYTIPIAKLEAKSVGSYSGTYPVPKTITYSASSTGPGDPNNRMGSTDTFDYQPLGINNPIAIADEDKFLNPANGFGLAWGNGRTPDRNDSEAHFNGNAIMVTRSNGRMGMRQGRSYIPVLSLDYTDFGTNVGVGHGRTSRQARLGVMDRSAMGVNIVSGGTPPKTQQLGPFRINASDLRFRGDESTVENNGGLVFPWEQGPGSMDYPHIYRRNENYLQASSDADPSKVASDLPQLLLKPPYTAPKYPDGSIISSSDPEMVPDAVLVQVDVPRFQPANMIGSGGVDRWQSGYGRSMEAYIDNNGNGDWDSGVVVRGRPALGQEPYRRFRVQLGVPADPRLEVDEQLIDVGSAPHGLGEMLNFSPFNPCPTVQQWYKNLTIKNAGNVNLWNIRVGKNLGVDALSHPLPLNLYSDASSMPLPGSEITSSLDPDWITAFGGSVTTNPFITIMPKTGRILGATITKPRVGDPDPTIMRLPDRRKWDANYNNAAVVASNLMAVPFADPVNSGTTWTRDIMNEPLPIEVGVRVPLTQPIGTYSCLAVPVYVDTNDNGNWEPYVPTSAGDPSTTGIMEPFANPTFKLKVTVKENQLTGGVSPTTLPQIDKPLAASIVAGGGFFPAVGDTTPAAFKDHSPDGGGVHVFWSSNRLPDNSLYASAAPEVLAKAPWFINSASLAWNPSSGGRWIPDNTNNPTQWWTGTGIGMNAFLPSWQWPSPPSGSISDLHLIPWEGNKNGSDLYTVRHHSPTIGENQDLIEGNQSRVNTSDLDWLAWIGTADKTVTSQDSKGNDVKKVAQEHMIFYTDATLGSVTEGTGADSTAIQSITHDLDMVKRSPSMAVFKDVGAPQENMWMFWQGGDSGRWGIYYSINDRGDDGFPAFVGNQDMWSPDMKLRTPDSLSSVTSPNALRRLLWKGNGAQTNVFDIVYAGTGKLSQNSDVIYGKYKVEPDSALKFSPARRSLVLPRVYNEKLERDAKYGYFSSKHLAWIRPASSATAPPTDPEGWGNRGIDNPFIHIKFPAGYKYTDATGTLATLGNVVEVSATDGSVRGGVTNGPTVTSALPDTDSATGISTYKYTKGSLAQLLLGETLVDFSAGVVRFAKDLKETPVSGSTDGAMNVPDVRAEYTPQAWRLTTDTAADTSPKAFIERTVMNSNANPRLGSPSGGPVDRLWVFWRKAGTSVNSSTIFYKTYRVGVELNIPIKMTTNSKGNIVQEDVTVAGYLGPWEVSSTGKRIYFTSADERYNSLRRQLGSSVTIPGDITIKYTDIDGNKQTVTADDVSWIEESPEQSLFGFSADTNVNEGGISAFADTNQGTSGADNPSKIWVFWTSTRGGSSDLYWETVSPNFEGR